MSVHGYAKVVEFWLLKLQEDGKNRQNEDEVQKVSSFDPFQLIRSFFYDSCLSNPIIQLNKEEYKYRANRVLEQLVICAAARATLLYPLFFSRLMKNE